MSYAVRNDGQGWRAVSGPDNVGNDEWYCIGIPPDPVPSPLTKEELAATERSYRDQELARGVWLRDRHRDQTEIAMVTTLSADQFIQLLVHMQALRDWPQSADFPDANFRPVAPTWMAEHIS
ncbi:MULTISPECIES: phage tail assembly chaperone [Pseudomonas]|uniref:phage tail assembly chaperone n=1 Tax=Pseudomonas TaxID=286 RepID=UPI0009FB2BDC|nr:MULTISPECIES: phage tail assembly chaperone [Pseudomonas]PZP05606.1 MAG: phage tail protein [Pseudomonas protegens]